MDRLSIHNLNKLKSYRRTFDSVRVLDFSFASNLYEQLYNSLLYYYSVSDFGTGGIARLFVSSNNQEYEKLANKKHCKFLKAV